MSKAALATSATTARSRAEDIEFYARPSAMTAEGPHAALLESLPSDAGTLAGIVQGLVVHEHVAAPFYSLVIPDKRRLESHIRPVEKMLGRILSLDDQPLTAARPPEKRLVGVCRHFAVLPVAMLRAKGVPARMRCGFGSYFNPGLFEDHAPCEYWNAAQARWVLVDPQFDGVWRDKLSIDHDVLDVPRDRFLVASDAWTRCRTGTADAATFGTFNGDLRGLWFIAGSLVHDVANLNKVEMLQWEVWGAMPRPDEPLQHDQLAFFDRLAALTCAPDSSFRRCSRSMRAMSGCACRRPCSTQCFNARKRCKRRATGNSKAAKEQST